MKKKIILFTLVLTVVATSAFASILQVGPTLTYKNSIGDFTGEEVSFNDFGLGADVRVNVPFLQIKMTGSIGGNFVDTFTASTIAGLNLRIAQGPIEFAIGPAVGIDFAYRDGVWTYNGQSAVQSAIKSSTLFYNASLGFNFGTIGINVSAYIPSSGTFESNFSPIPKWSNTRVMASVLFNFF